MEGLQVFENAQFGQVRTVAKEGQPWFVAADVCRALDLGQVTNTIRRLDDDEKALISIKGISRGNDQVSIINEPGLYSLVLGSRKPEAKAFKRWITHEVIPAIRKYGGYMTKSLLEQVLENPNLIYEFARRMLEEQQKNERLRQELDRAKPKADYYDAFMDADGCTNLRTTAKELNVPERWFARFLQQTGFLYGSPAGNLMPYTIPRNRGLFRVRDYVRNGHSGAYTLITPMGKSLFRELLRCGEALPTD